MDAVLDNKWSTTGGGITSADPEVTNVGSRRGMRIDRRYGVTYHSCSTTFAKAVACKYLPQQAG